MSSVHFIFDSAETAEAFTAMRRMPLVPAGVGRNTDVVNGAPVNFGATDKIATPCIGARDLPEVNLCSARLLAELEKISLNSGRNGTPGRIRIVGERTGEGLLRFDFAGNGIGGQWIDAKHKVEARHVATFVGAPIERNEKETA